MYKLKLVLSLVVIGLVSAVVGETDVPTYTVQVGQARAVNEEIQDAVMSVFDDELRRLVRESCIASTQALIGTVKDRILSSLTSLPLTLPAICCSNGKNNAEYFDALGTGKREWRLAFRGTPHIDKSMYQAYKDGTGVPTNSERNCKQINSSLPCSSHYRNNEVLDHWDNIEEVAFVIYKNNTKAHYIVFDAEGTNYMDWFSHSRVKHTSWKDLKASNPNYFSIDGHSQRKFFINEFYNHCPGDIGWFVVTDTITGCPWENAERAPDIKFATGDTSENWTTGDISRADLVAVFVKYFD